MTETDFRPSPDLLREGGNSTEGTTTSVSEVDIVTVSGLSIPVGTPFLVLALLRKSAGAAASASVGLKLNSTTVRSAQAWSGSTNAAESGLFQAWIIAGVTNHLRGGLMNTVGDVGGANQRALSTDTPTVTITSVVITGLVGNVAVTMGVDEVQVYTLTAS